LNCQSPLEIARLAWGDAMPDWVKVLAIECAKTSQAKVAKRLNRSASLVSTVLRAKYPGDMQAVEEIVRGVYLDQVAQCPVLGEVSTAECRDWMVKARSFSNENSERVRMFRACRACPRMKKEAPHEPH